MKRGLWIPLKRLLTVVFAAMMVLTTAMAAPAYAQTAAAGAEAAIAKESFVAAAVRKVGQAVVRIDTERTITRRNPDPFYDDPFFRDFFGGMPANPGKNYCGVRGRASSLMTPAIF